MADAEVAELDLADLGSVERFAQGFLASGRGVDMLINNAAVMACDLAQPPVAGAGARRGPPAWCRLAQAHPLSQFPPPRAEEVADGLRFLLDTWTAQPAVVIGRYRDVLAANRIAQVLNPGFVPGRNLVRHVFLDPEGRQYYLDSEEIAEGAVAGLRASAGAGPDDPRLTGLVGELSVKSEDFRQMWAPACGLGCPPPRTRGVRDGRKPPTFGICL